MWTREFWKSTCPELMIDAVFPSARARAVVPSSTSELHQTWREQGFAIFDTAFADTYTLKLERALLQLEARAIPAAYLAVYDEFWDLVTALQPLGFELLGHDYRLVPNFAICPPRTLKSSTGNFLFQIILSPGGAMAIKRGTVIVGSAPSLEWETSKRLVIEACPDPAAVTSLVTVRSSYIPTFLERLEWITYQLSDAELDLADRGLSRG